jgi:diguanylate cyclase (GGDEF)-like protein/PAS domain S-box-containing protein
VVALVGWTLWSARLDAARNAAIASENLAMSLARGIDGSISRYDSAMLAVATAIAAAPAADKTGPEVIVGMAMTPRLGSIAITDDTGLVIASIGRAVHPRGSNVAGQTLFLRQRTAVGGGLDIGQPFKMPNDGEWMIGLTRRLRRPDGRFDGIVMASLPLSEFQTLIERLDLGQRGAVTVLRQDGVILARDPYDKPDIGRDLKATPVYETGNGASHGAMVRRSGLDGTNKLFSYSKVGDLPLVVTVAISTDAIYADWQRHAAVIGSVTVTLLIGLSGAAVALRRELMARLEAEDAARCNTAQFRLLAENSSDIILRLDRDGVQRYVSPAAHDLLGHAPGAMVGSDWTQLAEAEDRPSLKAAMDRLRAGAERATVQYRCRHQGGHCIWVEASLRLVRDEACEQPQGAVATIRDITWRKQAEDELALATARLEKLAATDGLTGLANRRSFDETLQREWRRARRNSTHLALLLIDADWFKDYNDQYGHQKGDDALRAISSCIARSLKRPADFAARYGGEEFAVILPGNAEQGANQVAEDISANLADLAIPNAGTPMGQLTLSIGIAAAIVQTEGDASELVAMADAALYAAKRAGRDRTTTYKSPVMALAAG